MKKYLSAGIKGILMGAANVIPGVSGGTVALLTGIFHPLINALKSFDLTALRLLKERRFLELSEHINLPFLVAVGTGVLVSILTFARILDYLFEHYAIYVWSFFFGLIVASVVFVCKKIHKATAPVVLLFISGAAVAAGISFLTPAEENTSVLYLFLCGVVAICSMILPGLSGSYVLLLMGNYQLVMIDAVVHMQLGILLPVAAGAAIVFLAFARVLNWVFDRFHDQTVALLAGFILGSLSTLWPWKTANLQTFQAGDRIKEKVIGYTYSWPEWNSQTAGVLGAMIAGIIILVLTEKAAGCKKHNT